MMRQETIICWAESFTTTVLHETVLVVCKQWEALAAAAAAAACSTHCAQETGHWAQRRSRRPKTRWNVVLRKNVFALNRRRSIRSLARLLRSTVVTRHRLKTSSNTSSRPRRPVSQPASKQVIHSSGAACSFAQTSRLKPTDRFRSRSDGRHRFCQ